MKNQLLYLAASIICCATPSFAGQWSFEVKAEGTQYYSGGDNPWEEEDAVFDLPLALHGSFQSQISPGQTRMNRLKGSATADAIWTPSNANDYPPPYVNVRVNSHVSVGTSNSSFGTYILKNGFQHPVVNSQSVWNGAPYYYKSQGGSQLVSIDTSTAILKPQGTFVVTLPITEIDVMVTGSNSAPVGSSHLEHVGVNISYSVELDSRSTYLTRSGAPAALPEKVVVNNALVDNPDLKKERDEWVEADGTGHGHTLASYSERSLVGDEAHDDPIDVIQTINASRAGGWSPVNQLSYEWKPGLADNIPSAGDTSWDESKVLSEHRDYQIRQMVRSNAINNPDGVWTTLLPGAGDPRAEIIPNTEGWINIPSDKAGEVVNFQYDLKDLADSAIATGKYHLTLHDEWENPTDDETKFWVDAINTTHFGQSLSQWKCRPLQLVGPIATTGDNESEWDITATGSLSFNLSTSFGTGFKYKDWLNFGLDSKAAVDVELKATYKAGAPKPSFLFPGAPAGTSYQPVLKYKIRTIHKVFDKFSTSGWVPNPARQATPPVPAGPPTPPNDGKWPQAKDDDIIQAEPSWLKIESGQGPLTGDGDYPNYPAPDPEPEPENLRTSSPSGSAS